MKRLNLVLILTGVTIFFLGCSKEELVSPETENAEQFEIAVKKSTKPSSQLKGTFEITLGTVPGGPSWIGTMIFEGGEEVYGFRFFPLNGENHGQTFLFEEHFEIYDLESSDKVYLRGYDAGNLPYANKLPDPLPFRMHGEVEEAIEPFDGWLGRRVHIDGTVFWQEVPTPDGPLTVPARGIGEFRIN